MNLERITVEFVPEDDRLRAHVYFSKSERILFWMTRRLVQRFWPVLLQIAQSSPAIRSQANPEARKALLGFEHENALMQVHFSKAVQEPDRSHPLGEEPFLVTRIRARRNEHGKIILSLLPRTGNGFDLSLSENLLHGLMKLIKDSSIKAEWNLALDVPTFSATQTALPSEQRTLN